jgi:hypothetical protein
MQHVRRVALIYDARSAYDVKVMTGVASYVQQSMKWSVYLEEDALKDQRLPNLARLVLFLASDDSGAITIKARSWMGAGCDRR